MCIIDRSRIIVNWPLFQRRDDELFERDLNVDEFFGRQYDLLDERIFDEPEARGFFGGPLSVFWSHL